jgi:hypothetical protein
MDDQTQELIDRLRHESAEYQRLWGVISSLTDWVEQSAQEADVLDSLLDSTRALAGSEKNERIHQLEEKIVKMRAAIRKLEECRAFERETEQLLVQALDDIRHAPTKASMLIRANDAQCVHSDRKGPRPQEADASA